MNMFNPIMGSIMQMIGQGGGNPQAMVQQILSQNPEFAKQIQGQNVTQMAQQMLRQQGIDPGMIQNMMGRRR
jgi:isocitrate/isopropylmalate dehydrogenase